MTRKEMKARAKKSLKKHYLIFVAICVAAAILGTEFGSSLVIATAFDHSAQLDASITTVPGTTVTPTAPQPTESSNEILGHTRGVFAYLMNMVSSGNYIALAVKGFAGLFQSDAIAVAIVTVLAGCLLFLFWFLVVNPFAVISRRMFLEGRIYEKLPVSRLAFLFRIKRWLRASCTLFLRSVFQVLWSLTIVGGFIKHYSYFLVPYIVAENPGIAPLDAITLSRKLMKGHKWECFVLDLTFLGWTLLGFITLGLSGIFFSNPYKVAVFSQYFAAIRSQALNASPDLTREFPDKFLYEKPDSEALAAAYSDVLELLKKPVETIELPGFRGFLAKNFGILLGHSPLEEAYEESQAASVLIRSRQDALEGLAYPTRLSPIPQKERRQKAETMHYLRHYTIWSLLAMFFIFSMIGWLWEVSLHLIAEHEFVNRGVLHGPWLPIYGCGGILILVLLNRLRSHPVWELTCAVILCGFVEYFTAYFLELTHDGHKWWDYSGYFLNLHGRICAEGLLVFGLGGMAVVYLLAPMLDNYLRRIPTKIIAPVTLTLLLVFGVDQVYSSGHPNAGKGITDEVSAPASQTAMVSWQEIRRRK